MVKKQKKTTFIYLGNKYIIGLNEKNIIIINSDWALFPIQSINLVQFGKIWKNNLQPLSFILISFFWFYLQCEAEKLQKKKKGGAGGESINAS